MPLLITTLVFCSISIAEIGELEATRLQHESTIRDLTTRLESTQERLNMLETSKRALESRVGETEFQASNQIKSLEQVSSSHHDTHPS